MDWNGARFDPGVPGGHVESTFLKLNDPAGQRALWLKATILARRDAPPAAEGWAIAFERGAAPVAAKRSAAFQAARFSREGLDLECVGVEIAPRSTRGALRTRSHEIEWDLRFEGDGVPFVPLPRRLYDRRLPTSKLVTPHPDLRFRGHYRVDGQRVEVEGWPGMQGHNWGRRHPFAYAWVHCNAWQDAGDLVFEAITARVAIGPAAGPPLTLVLVQHRGVRHFFTPPASLWRARGRFTPRTAEFRAAAPGARLRARFAAQTGELAGLHYEDPDGALLHCLNSKLAEGELELEVTGRPRLEARTRAAALEIGTRDTSHGVAMLA